MEALSRGAETVKFIERDKEAALSIAKSLSNFGKEDSSGEVVCADANEWIRKNKETFDIIFIDGLHHYDQVIKDINNSLNILNKGFIPRDLTNFRY